MVRVVVYLIYGHYIFIVQLQRLNEQIDKQSFGFFFVKIGQILASFRFIFVFSRRHN